MRPRKPFGFFDAPEQGRRRSQLMNDVNKSVIVLANITNIHSHRFIRHFKAHGWKVRIRSSSSRRVVKQFASARPQSHPLPHRSLRVDLTSFKKTCL